MGQIIPHNQSGKKFLRYLGLKNEKKLRCFKNNWVSLDYLYERYGRSNSYKLFRKEFSCTQVHWQVRRPITFAVALLGTLVFPREHGYISTCICSVARVPFEGVDGEELTVVPMILAEIFRDLGKCKRRESNFFEGCNLLLQMWAMEHFHQLPRASEILHEWDNILTIDIGNGPEKEIPEYQVWFQEGRNNISSEGEQGFEDIGTTIWIRHSRLGTKIVTPEIWAQMENIMRYLDNAGAKPSNVGASSSLLLPALICVDYKLADHPYFTRSKARKDMTDSGASDQNGLGLVTVLRDEPETSEGMEPIPYNEHIANLMQKMANMQSEIDRLRNLTNLSITLNTPLPEHGTNTATPPLFSHVDSPTPQYFPPNPSLHKTNPTASKQSTNPQQPNFPQNNPQQANPLPFTTSYAPQTSLTLTPVIQTNSLTQTTPLTQTALPTQKYQATQHVPVAHTAIPNVQYVPQVYVAEAQPFLNPMPTMPEVDPYEEMEKEARSRTDDNVAREIHNLKEAFKRIQVHKGVEIPVIESMEELDGSVFHIREIVCATQVGKANLPRVLMMVAWEMLKNGFIPGQGLGAKLDGIVEPIQFPGQKYTFGLGYKPTPEEISSANLKKKSDIPAFAAQGLEEAVEHNLVEGLKNLFIEEAECNMILEDCTEASIIWDAMPEDALNNWTCNPSPVLRESW
ncbi:hypothetical protein H5410_027929 [Solanum commersonii]|uniref:G-patch domain-containing protein n=1 Tax=Solanum commersonii TaxID=4109 RepID=A0A9J5Z2L1_SOLCO|nr:hypothetical protein H5410_027929 [Solanum commersonii]